MIKLYDFPEKYEKRDTLFEVWCEGKRIDTYSCDVSAIPFNQIWQGKQRSFSQTEKSAFLSLENDGETVLMIKPKRAFTSFAIRPLAKNVTAERTDDGITAIFKEPGQYSVEFDGMHYALAVFINSEKDFSVYRNDQNTIYFAPGVHFLDERIMLEDGQTVYIDAGAVVYGSLNAINKKNIKVVGYGILDNSNMERENAVQSTRQIYDDSNSKTGLPIFFDRCENVLVEGITIVNSSEWTLKFAACKNVCVDNIKVIGLWRYNADGCDFCNCINAVIKNSFLRTFDDVIVVKGLNSWRDVPVQNILAENCVLWCDWGKSLEVGVESCAPYMKDITFKNCYLIHGSAVMMDVQQGDSANISNVLFDHIHIEYTGDEMPLAREDRIKEYPFSNEEYLPQLFQVVSGLTSWSSDPTVGNICDVKFRNIKITLPHTPNRLPASIATKDESGAIRNVSFKNLVCNSNPLSLKDIDLKIGGNVENVVEE